MPHGVAAVRRGGRILSVSFAVLAALVLSTASANAATRYAAPAGVASPACLQATPCDIETAIELAGAGDEVVVQPGVLDAGASQIDASASGLVIHGASAGAKPTIASSSPTEIRVLGANSVIRNLALSHTGTGGFEGGILLDNGSTGERLEVTSTGTFACGISGGGTLRDSICHSTAANAAALVAIGFGSTIGYARNVTAVAAGANSFGAGVVNPGSGVIELDSRNVIAKGLPDVSIVNLGTGTGAATMSYSDYATTQPPNGPTSTITPAGTATNITAVPQFVDAPAGDFHQLATSPTRNAGALDSTTGALDYEGDVETSGGHRHRRR